ncbi:MAG: TolC family protein [Opitutales bacterium]
MNFKNITIILAPLILAGCMSVDSQVAKKPTVYWKAPKEAMPEKFIDINQIETSKIVSENKAKTPSEKIANKEPLLLTDLIDIALENNTQTRQYWFQAKIYAAQKGKVDSQYLPTVDLSVQAYRDKTKVLTYATPAIGSFYETGYGPTLELNWLLYDFGKREASSLSAKESLRAANFDYNQSIQDLVLQVNEAYFNLYDAMGSVKASIADLEDAETAYKSAKERLDQGVGNKQDMLRALANAKNALFLVEKDSGLVETARANLAKVLSIQVSSDIIISEDISIPTSQEAQESVDSLMAQALKRREDILAAYARLRASEADTKVAEKEYMPKIGLSASAQWLDYTDSPYINAPYYNYSLGLSLSWSVFDGFNRQYEIISKKASENAQAQELKAYMVEIVSNVWAYYYSYQSAIKQVESAKAAMQAANESYIATKTGYDNGVNSLTDLLSAQSFLATARQQHVTANSNLAISIARLAHSTGLLFNQE